MKILIPILTLFFISEQAFCFPDMRKYPHEQAKLGTSNTLVSMSEHFIKMPKTRFKGFNGYMGNCSLTGYSIAVNLEGDEPICKILPPHGEFETSYFYMEVELGKGHIAKYFYFDKGRVSLCEGEDEIIAFWQMWDK